MNADEGSAVFEGQSGGDGRSGIAIFDGSGRGQSETPFSAVGDHDGARQTSEIFCSMRHEKQVVFEALSEADSGIDDDLPKIDTSSESGTKTAVELNDDVANTIIIR